MSREVFILGAGASAEAGAPLMRDFLDEAEYLLRSGKVEKHKAEFALVFEGIAALQAAYAKSLIDTQNVESVFSAFEMAGLVQRLGGLAPEKVQKLAPALRTVIADTLEQTVRYPISAGKIFAPPPYPSFLKDLIERGLKNASIITFNYDVALDYAFRGVRLDYALDGSGPAPGALEILKLHGSLNWTRCTECGKIFISDLSEFDSWPPSGEKDTILLISEQLPSLSHPPCRGHGENEPVIVPPALSKGEGQLEIRNVWRRAAANLSEAENVFVIGYSFPRNDEFFRYLVALGMIGDARLKNFVVYDPDPERAVEARFREFLGPVVKERFTARQLVFRNAVSNFPRLRT